MTFHCLERAVVTASLPALTDQVRIPSPMESMKTLLDLLFQMFQSPPGRRLPAVMDIKERR